MLINTDWRMIHFFNKLGLYYLKHLCIDKTSTSDVTPLRGQHFSYLCSTLETNNHTTNEIKQGTPKA